MLVIYNTHHDDPLILYSIMYTIREVIIILFTYIDLLLITILIYKLYIYKLISAITVSGIMKLWLFARLLLLLLLMYDIIDHDG